MNHKIRQAILLDLIAPRFERIPRADRSRSDAESIRLAQRHREYLRTLALRRARATA